MENVKLNAVKLLSKKLSKDGLKCVPEGVHHIEEIYSLVKAEYPQLCDDTLRCKDVCSCGANQPEWKHRVRNIMTRLKNKGRATKGLLARGYWRISWREADQYMDEIAILDATCGGRMIWFNKNHPNTLYMDVRSMPNGTLTTQPNWAVKPDVIGDWSKKLDFPDWSFHHICWDIPHVVAEPNEKSIILTKYGVLNPTWEKDVANGFKELWRVLKPYGTLNFKYADIDIKVSKMLSLFPVQPLYGTRTKKAVNGHGTYWFTFVKIPE